MKAEEIRLYLPGRRKSLIPKGVLLGEKKEGEENQQVTLAL